VVGEFYKEKEKYTIYIIICKYYFLLSSLRYLLYNHMLYLYVFRVQDFLNKFILPKYFFLKEKK